MERTSNLEGLAQGLTALVALACLANALFMMLAPMSWYATSSTVQATGPANRHFIVDIGLTYLSSGLLLAYGAWSPSARRGALLAGTLWLAAHGLFHCLEFLTGEAPLRRFLTDAPAVLGPPIFVLFALWLTRASGAVRRDSGPRTSAVR
jgi:hypothetical protein